MAKWKRPKIGDIFEIITPNGFLFYAQYTHKDNEYGELIQITKNHYKIRPDNVEEILSCEIGIITFIPLCKAYKDEEFILIDNAKIPENRLKFPVFRIRGNIDKNGTVRDWKFWDGEKSWPSDYIKTLNSKELKLPIRGVWNKDLLMKRLEEGWMPEDYGK